MPTQLFTKKITRYVGLSTLYAVIIFSCLIIFTANIIELRSIQNKNNTLLLKEKIKTSQDIIFKRIGQKLSIDVSNTPTEKKSVAIIDKIDLTINGIVITSRPEDTFVLVNEGGTQRRYRVNEALKSNSAIKIRKINRTNVIFEAHDHMQKVMLQPDVSTSDADSPSADATYVLADVLIATPVRDGNRIHGLRLQPKTGYEGFQNTLLQPGDIAVRLNNISLTGPDEIAEALSALLTLQSVQFTVRRNGMPRLINISVNDIIGKNGNSDERTQ